ncbi:hypothetical protein D3C85_1839620 [compost metagenome]
MFSWETSRGAGVRPRAARIFVANCFLKPKLSEPIRSRQSYRVWVSTKVNFEPGSGAVCIALAVSEGTA